MTNLSSTGSNPWLSRERLLVGVPLLVGGLMASVVALVWLRPGLERVDALRQRLVQLQQQQQSLPSLERNLAQAQQKQQAAEDQLAVLVDLIAGRERIQTFMAWLDQDAQAAGVELKFYEPTASAPAPPVQRQRAKRRGNSSKTTPEESAVPEDPLLALGYRKTSLLLRVQGGFTNLQAFLQRMERLQLLVESSDLELEQVELPSGNSDQADVAGATATMLGLRLSFYDKNPDVAEGAAGATDAETESASLEEAPN